MAEVGGGNNDDDVFVYTGAIKLCLEMSLMFASNNPSTLFVGVHSKIVNIWCR